MIISTFQFFYIFITIDGKFYMISMICTLDILPVQSKWLKRGKAIGEIIMMYYIYASM
jgi:hypothetical protein